MVVSNSYGKKMYMYNNLVLFLGFLL